MRIPIGKAVLLGLAMLPCDPVASLTPGVVTLPRGRTTNVAVSELPAAFAFENGGARRRFSALAAIAVAAAMFSSSSSAAEPPPQHGREPTTEAALVKSLPGFTHATAQVNGIELHYMTGGEGSPLVLLSGWPETSWSSNKVMHGLAKHYRVIAIDLHGMGGSGQPEETVRLIVEFLGAREGRVPLERDIEPIDRRLRYFPTVR